ncbi:hypothetical protein BH11ARM2_BH11ARM2_29670 [soil metagenome]
MREIALKSGTEIELIEREGRFLGLGAIHQGPDLLRDGSRPMFVEIRNPSAVHLRDYRLLEERAEGDAVVLTFEADREQAGTMEWMLHTVRNRYAATDWAEPPRKADDTRLELVLKPVERTLGGETFRGFSYQYRYRSGSIPIYKILDRATWEPGGSVVGSQFWMRNGVIPAILPVESLEDRVSTEWHLPPIEQPNIFQFFPLQMAMQGFTFTASPLGTLVTWPTRPAHVRSLFEKHAGKGAMFHWHEHCGDLGNEFETAPVEVLWLPSRTTDRVALLNRYEAVRDHVWTALHEAAGMRYEVAEPYGIIEEWTVPDMAMYRDKAVPALLDAGARTIFLPNEFQNNMNVWGVSNMCCNVDFKLPEAIDKEAFHGLCAKVREAGGKVEMWGNTALSSLTEIFSRKNDTAKRIDFLPGEDSVMEVLEGAQHPWVRNASGAIEADHYTPVFCALNLREPKVVDYWMRRWTELHEETGVDQIFVDSSFNMSADKFTHRQNDERERAGGATLDQSHLLGSTRPLEEPRQAIESQYLAYLDLLAAMQKAGYTICGEDVGLFGLSRSGPDLAMRLPCLPLWLDSYCDFDPGQARKSGAEPDDAFFRGLAYRVMWKLYFDVPTGEVSFRIGGAKDDGDRPRKWHTDVLDAYRQALPLMQRRTILDGERGVRYDAPEGSVIWAFAPIEIDLGGEKRVEELLSGETSRTARLSAEGRRIYQIEAG